MSLDDSSVESTAGTVWAAGTPGHLFDLSSETQFRSGFGVSEAPSRFHRRPGQLYGCQREAQTLPFVISAAQRAHAFNAQLDECHCRLGSRGLAGASAKQHHVTITRNLIVSLRECLRRNVQRTG